MSVTSAAMACLSTPAPTLICQLGAAMPSPPPHTHLGAPEGSAVPHACRREAASPTGGARAYSHCSSGTQELSQHLSHLPPPPRESR